MQKQYKKKTKNNNNLLNLLFKSKNLYGTFFRTTNAQVVPFVYGIRHKYSIINIKLVSLFIKRIFKVIKSVKKKRGYILIIGNSNDILFLTNKYFTKNNKKIILFKDIWVNGLITNNLLKKKVKLLIQKKKIHLILIIKSKIKEQFLSNELTTLQIPIISLLNTEGKLKHINYPIITNTTNIQSLYMIMYLLRKLF